MDKLIVSLESNRPQYFTSEPHHHSVPLTRFTAILSIAILAALLAGMVNRLATLPARMCINQLILNVDHLSLV